MARVLLVSLCREPLHEREFVQPVKAVLAQAGHVCTTTHYTAIPTDAQATARLLDAYSHVILCGTSLQDDDYLKDVERFAWLRTTTTPVLGICAGMQLLGLLHGGTLRKQTEIGYYREELQDFLGLDGEVEVYHLHNHAVDFHNTGFTLCSNGADASAVAQAVSKKNERGAWLYGVLFHPEVRQHELLRRFAEE